MAKRQRDPSATRAVAYLRVSTEQQADHGVSLDAQRAKVQAYAELYDVTLVAVEVDAGESAKSLDRPGLQRALAMLDAGDADALLVVKLDRLTRSVRDLSDLIERYFRKRAALLSVSEQVDTRSASGRMVLGILTQVGQWEREAIGERTSAALQHKRSRGEYTGGAAPFGFEVDPEGALVPHAGEQAAITAARALRAEGYSLRRVARALAEYGHVSRTGRVFDAAQVARMTTAA